MTLSQKVAIRLALRVALLACAATCSAQEEHGFTPADLERGQQIFFNSCAGCHGADGDAIPGVNFQSGKFRRAATDRDLIQIIQKGVPGTEMPPSNYTEAQAAVIAAYLRSMANSPAGKTESVPGDAARGKRIVESKGRCLSCHTIGRSGGFLGPELTAIGSGRPSRDLQASLTEPSAQIRANNRTVRTVDKAGKAVTGRLLNQDTYSLQLLDGEGRLRSLAKRDLREFEIPSMSPMPSFANTLSSQEIADVVSYLTSLKGQN